MKEIHHLTLQDRQAIQCAIEEGKTKAEVGRLLGKDPCEISREIIRHREFRERNVYNRPILCAKRKDCKIRRCTKACKEYEEPTCIRRDRLPGVCNGCEKRADALWTSISIMLQGRIPSIEKCWFLAGRE